MSTKYKTADEIPNDIICHRLDELSDAVTKGNVGIQREFYMSVPAQCDKDADLILSAASKRIKDQTDDTIRFPIMAPTPKRNKDGKLVYPSKTYIPWWLAEIAFDVYSEKFGNEQSLERLAERGGFGRRELLGYLKESEYLKDDSR